MNQNFRYNERVIQRPILSPNNEYIAFITHEPTIQILSIRTGLVVSILRFAKATRAFLLGVKFLKWSSETILYEEDLSIPNTTKSRAWILLAGDHRLIVLEFDLFPGTSSAGAISADAQILADYQFEPTFGCITTADFVLDHNHALVTFEMNTHASLISLTRPRRDDIPSPKFSDSRGIAQSEDRRNFSLLLRSKGQDQVATFSLKSDEIENLSTFSPRTIDAQGLIWSPRGDPVLVIWDSAMHGLSVHFFTVLGHHLKQLDLRPKSNIDLHDLPLIGVTSINWTIGTENNTLLAFGIGDVKLLIQEQNERSMTVSRRSTYSHPSIIGTTGYVVWQQTNKGLFEIQPTAFEITLEPAIEINLIEMNYDKTMFTTRLDTLPKVLWIWSRNKEQPIALHFFQNDIKQVIWHPTRTNILAIITNDKRPCIYIYHNLSQPPAQVVVPFESIVPTNKWAARWVSLPEMNRSPFLFSSSKQFELGLLSHANGKVDFESILQLDASAICLEEDVTLMQTPSKPDRAKRGTAGWTLDGTTELWDPTLTADQW